MLNTAEVYIDGDWHRGEGSELAVYNPVDGSTLVSLRQASLEQTALAIVAAERAQRGWARLPTTERGIIVRQIAQLIRDNSSMLASLVTQEVGKRPSEADDELAFAASFMSYNAEWDRRIDGDLLPGDVAGEHIELRREPLGVIAAICPWNFPVAVLCRKLGPALVTGNTIVVKPSEISPLSTIALFRLIDEHVDIPAGVLNLVVGDGTIGEAMVNDPLTAMVTFTGHRDTGKRVMETAALNLTRVSLELGGKAPAIVWHDADLDITVPAILEARHANCGQVCTSAERVLVHRSIVDEFTQRYALAVGAMRAGDPRDGVDLGPMASSAQLDKTLAAIDTAVAEGATVVSGGGRFAPSPVDGGYWCEPTVLGDVDPSMSIATEEIFGPVTPIIAVDSFEQAIGIANGSRYGLSAYVFSSDYSTVLNTVDQLEFGEIYVNRTLGESVHAHHAGWKESGMGGEDGKWGVLRYTQLKTVYQHYGTP